MRIFESLGMKILSRLPPETAHSIARKGMLRNFFARGTYCTEESRTKLFDVELPNPLGIAAGFDKYAELQDNVRNYGFGWIELGSFTLRGGNGNKKPREFRLQEGCLLNRMGLPCLDSWSAARILEDVKDQTTFAINVAKTSGVYVSDDASVKEIVEAYNHLKNFGIYTAINLSCPNTPNGKEFEKPSRFRDLISGLTEAGKGRPLVFKFSPLLSGRHLKELVSCSDDLADGYEVVNTLPLEHEKYGKGGLSGPSLCKYMLQNVRLLREITEKTILAVGGISEGRDVYFAKQAGANAFLAFTGFVRPHRENPYAGPRFAHDILGEYFNLRRKNGS